MSNNNEDNNKPIEGIHQHGDKLTITINLEEYFKEDREHPEHDPGVVIYYRIKVDDNYHEVRERHMTGSAILALEGKATKHFDLWQHHKNDGTPGLTPIQPEESVDFGKKGIERFTTKHVYPFFIGKTEYVSKHEELTAKAILQDFAKVDPDMNVLGKKIEGGYHKYKNEDKVRLEDCPHFELFSKDPTGVS
jgi:hypothetical protein